MLGDRKRAPAAFGGRVAVISLDELSVVAGQRGLLSFPPSFFHIFSFHSFSSSSMVPRKLRAGLHRLQAF